MVTCSPPRPLLRVWGCSWRLTLDPAGWGWSLCQRLLFAPCSRWCLHSWWSSLRLRVFGGYWSSPLCFHDRRYDSRATCSALPPVSRLSFVLGEFSFWLGLRPLPDDSLVRLRPLPDDSLGALGLPARLLWPSLRLRVCESSGLSAWSFPFRGPTPISRLFLSWRPCQSRSLIPSLAPSWWCPCLLMRWALLALSGYVLSVPSAFSLRRSRWSTPSHCRPSRAVSLRLPVSWVPSEPLGVCGGPTYIALHQTWLVSAILPLAVGAQVGVSYLPTRSSACIYGNNFVSITDLCVSLTKHSHRVVHWTLEEPSYWVDLVSPSSLFQDSVDCADF